MGDFAAGPGQLAASAPEWQRLGEALKGLGDSASVALQLAAGAAGDAGLTGALGAAAASAQASLHDTAVTATAFGPALTATARNYWFSDLRSARGLGPR